MIVFEYKVKEMLAIGLRSGLVVIKTEEQLTNNKYVAIINPFKPVFLNREITKQLGRIVGPECPEESVREVCLY